LLSLKRRFFLVALAVTGALSVAAPLPAQEEPDPRNESELRVAIGEASEAEQAAIAEVAAVRERKAALDEQASALDAQVSEATVALDAARREVERIDAELAPVRAEVTRIRDEIEATRAKFEDSTASLYRNAGNGAYVLPVLSYISDDPSDATLADRYLTTVSEDAKHQTDRFLALQEDLEVAKAALEQQRGRADEARAAVEAQRAEVQRLRSELEPVRAAVAVEEDEEARLLADVLARKGEWEQELAQLQAEQAALAQLVSRGSGEALASASAEDGDSNGGGQPSGGGPFLWPCSGNVGSGFGYRVHPISGTSRMHTGVDIGCANGAPISAAGAGVVAEAGWRGGYGNAVVIDHGNGLATLYAHQSSIAASAGQQVSSGQTIGYVGSTGYSTGPHLHWEVWVNGEPVDPMGYV
jgi:murein DD-endopeptidase MepM/ murein hydrolase activator NlpD